MTADLDDEDDDEEIWAVWGGWYGANVSPPPPVYGRNMYIQECPAPACHTIHETVDQFSQWCEEHTDMKALWQRRNSPTDEDKALGSEPWVCQGCERCEAA